MSIRWKPSVASWKPVKSKAIQKHPVEDPVEDALRNKVKAWESKHIG